ncbi:hypothetical protein EX30DRAFT_397091, partial [Ascodesmis nigricans]
EFRTRPHESHLPSSNFLIPITKKPQPRLPRIPLSFRFAVSCDVPRSRLDYFSSKDVSSVADPPLLSTSPKHDCPRRHRQRTAYRISRFSIAVFSRCGQLLVELRPIPRIRSCSLSTYPQLDGPKSNTLRLFNRPTVSTRPYGRQEYPTERCLAGLSRHRRATATPDATVTSTSSPQRVSSPIPYDTQSL